MGFVGGARGGSGGSKKAKNRGSVSNYGGRCVIRRKGGKFVDSDCGVNFGSASTLRQVRTAPRFSAFQRKRGAYRCSSIIMSRAIKIAATDNVIAKNRPSMLVSNGHVGTAETLRSSICSVSSFSIRVSTSRESS